MTGEAKHSDSKTGPLNGLTVLDVSQVLVGPFCTMQLGDLGANVIKIERPNVGDQTRTWHPPKYKDSDESAYNLSINRNKKSVTLDLQTKEGRTVFRDLANEADILVENFRTGKMEEWGLGYKSLRKENSGLIFCSLSGYGEWGPDRDRPAYDIIIQAEAGLMSITGNEDGAPVRVGVAIADIGTGMYACQAILSALLARELGDGEGQKIDVSLLDTQVAWMTYMASYYFGTGESPKRMGSKHPTISPYQAFPTQDGYAVIAAPSQKLWSKFCEAIDRTDLIKDDRFATNAARVSNRDILDDILENELHQYKTGRVISMMNEYGVPASEVKDMAAVFKNSQIEAREMHQSIQHPLIGDVEMPGSPMHFSQTPTSIRRHPPQLGEHTTTVLREYGYEDHEIEYLDSNGII